MLKSLMLRKQIDRKKDELTALREKEAEFETREKDLESAINEAQTEDEQTAVNEAVEQFDADKKAHEDAEATLTREIEDLEAELANEEREKTTIIKKTERSKKPMEIRNLPKGTRAFEALPEETRTAILEQEDVKAFLGTLRSMRGQTRAISGGELTIPVVLLDLISANMYRYSKLLNRVRVREVGGTARQTIAGTVPEAVWTEMCGNINELTFVFNQITLDGYKVGGFIPVCNQLLNDSDVNLASWIVEMLSESLGFAKDKAILYGKGAAYHMPLGIVTRLAQTSEPASYPANAPAWTDLHTSNMISINAAHTGAEFWSDLQIAAGNCYTKYSRGQMFWAMNSKTYAKLKSKAITFTASGDVVANVFGLLPIVTGDIDILEFMPDNDIVGGFGDLYLWAQRGGMTLGMDEYGYTNRVQDQTLFFGRECCDGQPIIAGAFVAININGSTPTSDVTFASDKANTVSGIVAPANAAIVVGNTIDLNPVLLPFGVDGTITYTSATTAKATVSSAGIVTGVASGSSVITMACGGKTATCTVTVTSA